ncbi:type III secretion system cytoplasmic ring protein SctQ [Pseudomonas sp. Z5-35]|uniref:type III secretion system cytoplasmic ring protein SctQ n=1 Tax=unclassified Pseudomonas TaxID=196821 RepID=UPI003DA85B2B
MTCRERECWAPEPGTDTALSGLPIYDPQWLTLHNRLHRPRAPWQGHCADQPVSVLLAGVTAPVEPLLDIHLSLGDHPLVLQLPTPALELLGLADYPLEHLQRLPGALLLELALLSLIEPLEQLTGQSLRVMDPEDVADSPPVLSLMLQVEVAQHSPWAVPLHMSAHAARLIAELLDQYAAPATQPLAALYLPLAVEGGEAWLSVAELRSLRPGDVLMLEDWPEAQVRLVLGAHRQARAERDGETLKLLEKLTAVNFLKEHPMSVTTVGSDLDTALDTTLDDLPLKLVCQVGSVDLSLAQLRELGAGSLVQLAPQMHAGVDLMVNGRRVGQGQLVKIGDGLGVRLLSFCTP